MNDNPLEKVIEKRVCDHAKKLGYLTYKFNSEARRSVPDRMFVSSTGVIYFIEFKRKGKKPTTGQERELKRLHEKNVPVFVIDDVKSGVWLVDAIEAGFPIHQLSINNLEIWGIL